MFVAPASFRTGGGHEDNCKHGFYGGSSFRRAGAHAVTRARR